MGQALKPTALVVEDDEFQRSLMSILLEESDMTVIQCGSAEAAVSVLEYSEVSMMFTDVDLAGRMDGIELARQREVPQFAHHRDIGHLPGKISARRNRIHGEAVEFYRRAARGPKTVPLDFALHLSCCPF